MRRSWRIPVRSLLRSYRAQLLLLSAVAAAVGTLALSWIAYQTALDSIEEQALQTVATVASSREQGLVQRLRRDVDRARGFLDAARFRCQTGRAPEQIRACFEDALGAYLGTEGAFAGRIDIEGFAPIEVGDVARLDTLALPPPGQIVRFAPARPAPFTPRDFTLAARRGEASVIVAFSSGILFPMFSEGFALGRSGETFLVDSEGFFLTPPRYATPAGILTPIDIEVVRRCLDGEGGETIAPDYRGAEVVHGFRFVPEAGDVCVEAHVETAEAFGPALTLRRRMIAFGSFFTLAAIAVAALVASSLTRPLGRLTERVRRLRAGDYETPVPVEGPRELRTLAATFGEMARAIHQSRHALETSSARARFLGETTAVLASSLDSVPTLRKLAHLSIPTLGDWCVVTLLSDGIAQHVAVAHVDRSKEDLARTLEGRVVDAGPFHIEAPVIHPVVDDPAWVAKELGADHPDLVRSLGAVSYMLLPMIARQRTLGVLSFVSATRRFGRDELALAEQLAQRAAVAIDNARLYELAQRAIRARDDVLAVVSHDLKNPVNTIAMSATMLDRRAPDGETGDFVRRHAEVIERSSQRIRMLVEDLLDLASIEAGSLTLRTEALAPCDLGGDVIEVLQPIAAERNVQLRCDIPRSLPLVKVDRKRAYQILANVVGNGVKFGREGGWVRLHAQPQPGCVLFTVEDNGPGIDGDVLPRIFERNYKTGPRGGTGLGLYIARALTEAHGGQIHVESVCGEGTIFTISFPSVTPDSRAPSP